MYRVSRAHHPILSLIQQTADGNTQGGRTGRGHRAGPGAPRWSPSPAPPTALSAGQGLPRLPSGCPEAQTGPVPPSCHEPLIGPTNHHKPSGLNQRLGTTGAAGLCQGLARLGSLHSTGPGQHSVPALVGMRFLLLPVFKRHCPSPRMPAARAMWSHPQHECAFPRQPPTRGPLILEGVSDYVSPADSVPGSG